MRPTLISLCLLVLAVSAQAQERVVRLQSGGTVWQVLANQGCDTAQIASLWPLVVADSGLDPRNDRSFPVDTPIAIKRDCDGQPFGESVLRFENEELKKRVAELTAQLGDSKEEAAKLQEEVKRLTGELADAGNLPAIQALGVPVLALVLGLATGSFLSGLKKKPLPDTVESPAQVVTEHNLVMVVAKRFMDPGACTIGYVCPFCKTLIFWPKNLPRHYREQHPEEGRIQWVFPQERAPDSPSL